MAIQEYQNDELLICVKCNMAYRDLSTLSTVKYENCPYCTTELAKISQLIKEDGE